MTQFAFVCSKHSIGLKCNSDPDFKPNVKSNVKPNVKLNVDYIRRIIFVPLLSLLKDVEGYFRTQLLESCENLMEKHVHYVHKIPVNTLFEKNLAACIELPVKAFTPLKIIEKKANGYGEFILEITHRYVLESYSISTLPDQ